VLLQQPPMHVLRFVGSDESNRGSALLPRVAPAGGSGVPSLRHRRASSLLPICLVVARAGGQKPGTARKVAAGHLGWETVVPCGRWWRSSPAAPGAPSTLRRSVPQPLVADLVPRQKDLRGAVRCVGEQLQQALWRRRLQLGGAEVRRPWRACRTRW
jgi:hypothetical protein